MEAFRQTCVALCLLFIWWLFAGERKKRHEFSSCLWIPLLWLLIVASKPVSSWLGVEVDANEANLEGSPLDALVYLVLIVAGLVVLARRKVIWSVTFTKNKWLCLYLIYLGISVLWADYSFVSLKRWIKYAGTLVMVLIVLTEGNPVAAVRALLLRCVYVLVPLSALLIAAYPNIGRMYAPWGGQPFYCGVTLNKNCLGATLLVCAISLCWASLESRVWKSADRRTWVALLLLMGLTAGLLYLANSATSISCSVVGIGLLLGVRAPSARRLIQRWGVYALVVPVLLVLVFHQVFDLGEAFVGSMGRDLTLTGRTEIWKRCLEADINPMIGTGYNSFWEGDRVRKISEGMYYNLNEAHNGYLETYLNSGWIGVLFLVGLLVGGTKKITRALENGTSLEGLRLAFIVAVIVHNVTECTIDRLGPLSFVLVLVLVEFSPVCAQACNGGFERLEEPLGKEFTVNDDVLASPGSAKAA